MATSELVYSTEAARMAGLDKDMVEKVSTVFAPSDQALTAYASAHPDVTTALSTGPGITAVSTHVIPNLQLKVADIPEGESSFPTVSGAPITVIKRGSDVMVGNAKVIKSDIVSGNAIIHIIDNVLAPVA